MTAFFRVGQTSMYVRLMETGEETCKAQSARANRWIGGPEERVAWKTQEHDDREPRDLGRGRENSQSSLSMAVKFHKVTSNTELVNTNPTPRRSASLVSFKPLFTFLLTD